MTEDLKNTETEETTEETTEDQFEVVVPEPNRVEMPATEYKEYPDYLNVFANFYIAKFEQADLEIMAAFDGNHDIIEINTYILANEAFGRRNLIKHVLNIHAQNFENILANIKAKTGLAVESVRTFDEWNDWYSERRNNISQTPS